MKNNPFAIAQKYLDKPTRMTPAEIRIVLTDDDLIVPVAAWFPEFHVFHRKVIAETPSFDYLWLKENRPDLYRDIRAKENELDALGDARLSQVMAIIQEWRTLVLRACFEQRELQRMEANKPRQGDLKLRTG